MTTSLACGACDGALVAADRFCAVCGAKVPEREDVATAGAPLPPAAPPLFGAGISDRIRNEHFTRARRWLMAVAVLTAGFGVVFYMMLPAELHEAGRAILVTNLGLGAFYFAMWVWAKKNLLGAAATALVVFVAVIVINAAIDPITLTQGILIKMLFIAALGSSVREALADRSERAGR